jgi:hypothetical protein
MGAVVANMWLSLDGFVEDAEGQVDQVFTWVTRPGGGLQFRLERAA